MCEAQFRSVAIGGIAQKLRAGEFKCQLFVEGTRQQPRNPRGSAIVTREKTQLPAVRGEAGAIAEVKTEHRAISQQGLQHVALVRPAFEAASRAHAEPVGAA